MSALRLAAILALAAGLSWLSGAPAAIHGAGAAQDDPRLDRLFARLHATADAAEASLLQQGIWSLWMEAHDDGLNALMRDGGRAMRRGELDRAIALFSQLIEAAPGFAEAWNRRATAYYLARRFDRSVADCMEVLALEPRHFGALSGLGLIESARGDRRQALHWFRQALAQNPHMASIRRRVEELARELEGEAI